MHVMHASIPSGTAGGVFAMRINSKGQVTIPQDVRERAGLVPGTSVSFEIDGDTIHLLKVTPADGRRARGQKLVEDLGGRGDFKMSTDGSVALMRGPPADEG